MAFRFLSRLTLLSALLVPFALAAPVACPTGSSLAQYQSSFSVNPCGVGPYVFAGFQFLAIGANSTSITASNINVAPNSTLDGLNFSSPLFNGTFPTLQQYIINFNVDPAPIVGGESLSLDPPQGGISITEFACANVGFSAAQDAIDPTHPQCADGSTVFSITVTPGSPFAQFSFPVPAELASLRLLITLNGTVTGLDGIGSTTISSVPEPATAASLAAGLLFLLAARFRRRW